MITDVQVRAERVIAFEFRNLADPVDRERVPVRCRVILLDDAARSRAAAKRKPIAYPLPDPDNLTAA